MEIILYREVDIKKNYNMIVDDFSDYLNSLSSVTVSNNPTLQATYFKHNINTTIILKDNNDFLSGDRYKFNYIYIKNTGEFTGFYYFIDKAEKIANNSHQLTLTMDVLNSFRNYYAFDARTRIIREHKNRFRKSLTSDGKLVRVIDKIPEDLGNPNKYRTKDVDDIPSEPAKWYIFYISTESGPKILLTSDNVVRLDFGNGNLVDLTPVDAIDTTDQSILRIIATPVLPYPKNLNFSEIKDGHIIYTAYVGVRTFKQQIGSRECTFIDMQQDTFLFPFQRIDFASVNLGEKDIMTINPEFEVTVQHSNIFESKLYNSNYYSVSFYYDSFSKILNLEQYANRSDIVSDDFNISITFTQASGLSSNCMFRFKLGDGFDKDNTLENYEHYLICNRRNELPLTTDAYLNYIRNGYNYDVKTQKQNITTGALGTGAAIATAVVAGANPAVAAVGIAAAAAAQISSIVSSTRNIEQKKQDALNQGFSVSGAEDLSLLTVYNGNALHVASYSIDDYDRKLISDYFHLYGYKCNEYGVPDIDSRRSFNFVQCEPVFKFSNETYKNLVRPYLDYISVKYKEGVTYYHKAIFDKEAKTYDFEQKYENFETFILDADGKRGL